MTEDITTHGVRARGSLGQQMGLLSLGFLGGALVAWLAMAVVPSVTLGGMAALLVAAVLYRSRPLRAAALGTVVGGGSVVAFFAYLFFVAADGLSAM